MSGKTLLSIFFREEVDLWEIFEREGMRMSFYLCSRSSLPEESLARLWLYLRRDSLKFL